MGDINTRTVAVVLIVAAALVSLGTLPWLLATAVLAVAAVFMLKGQRWSSLAVLAVAALDGVLALLLLLGLVLFIFTGNVGFWHVFFFFTHSAAAVLALSGALLADHARRRTRGSTTTGRPSANYTGAGKNEYAPEEPGLDATGALKSFGMGAGRWGWQQAKGVPGRVSNMRQDIRRIEEEGERARQAADDRLIREERIHAAKAARRRRTGTLF